MGHKRPFRTSLVECPVSGAKQPLGTRILEGYDLNASERLLSPKADVDFLKISRIGGRLTAKS